MVILAIYWYDRNVPLHEKMLIVGVFLLYATVLLADEAMTEYHWHLVSCSVIMGNGIARGG